MVLPAFAAAASLVPLAERAASTMKRGEVHVEPLWLSAARLDATRRQASSLLWTSERERGTVGGGRRVEAGLRRCATLDLLSESTWPAVPAAVQDLVREVDELRSALATASRRALLDSAELQLLWYPPGGHYAKHVDVGAATRHLPVCRSISLLIYLTPDDWCAADGGQLRVHRGSSWHDIESAPGSLVLFDSASVLHEVLPTRRERLCLVGWLHEARGDGTGAR